MTVEPLPKGGGRYDISRPLWKTAHERFSEEQTWQWCRQGLIESASWAREHGVTLALQNHEPVIHDYPDVLGMVREVDSPNLKVCLDAPLLKQKDEAAVRKAALEVGLTQTLSHFGGEYEEAPDGAVQGSPIYGPFVRAMAEIGYTGYIGYELCHPLPVINGQTVGIEFVTRTCGWRPGSCTPSSRRDAAAGGCASGWRRPRAALGLRIVSSSTPTPWHRNFSVGRTSITQISLRRSGRLQPPRRLAGDLRRDILKGVQRGLAL